jgi:hypothetical protein
MGREALFAKHPAARGYLRDSSGFRLYERREKLVAKLLLEIERRKSELERGSRYALAPAAAVEKTARKTPKGAVPEAPRAKR